MNPLGFPNWNIATEERAEGAIRYTAEYNQLPLACPRCGILSPRLYRHETRQQLFLDTPMHGQRVGILLLRRRFKCLECGKTFYELPPELDEAHLMTRRLVAYIERQSLRRPFTHIADEVGVHERTIRSVFRAYINQIENIPVMPMDSTITPAQTPFTVYTSLCALFGAPGRTSVTIIDPYVDITIFDRFLWRTRPEATVTIVTSKPANVPRRRWEAFLDVSQLFAIEFGPQRYRLLVNPDLHDRFLMFDDHELYVLGTSINNAAMRAPFSLSYLPAQEHRASIDGMVTGREYFGPSTPRHLTLDTE